MAPSPQRNPKEGDPSDDLLMADDDATVAAETPTTKTDYIAAEMKDINIRYEIPHRHGQAHSDDYKQHVKLLIALTKSFDKSTIRIYDNKNNRVKSFSEKKWMDKEYYDEHFTLHDEPRQRKSIVAHRILTRKTLTDLKSESNVHQQLKKTNTYLRAHFWKEDEISLQDIGFLLSYVPTKHSKECVKQDMHERCVRLNRLKGIDLRHAPPFQLIHAQPKVNLPGRKSPIKTHAFSVQVLATDATKMNKFLQNVYEDDPLYMPYTMKRHFPKAVAAAIMRQNQLIKDTWVIVLVGIPRDIMPALENTLLESPGVIGISSTTRTEQTGRWNILVKEASFKDTRKRFTKHIKSWVQDLHVDTESLTVGFPAPQVYQKNPSDNDDDSSFGQASYMSSCAQSYGSFDSTDEALFQPPSSGRFSSYAAALSSEKSPQLTPTQASQKPIDLTIPTNVELKEYQSTIANLQSEVTIATLQAEIKQLRAQLVGAHTPSTVTEMSQPTLTNTDTSRMDSLETSMAAMAVEFTKWMTEVRHLVQPPAESDQGTKHFQTDRDEQTLSQKSKRADTRSTPDRTYRMDTHENEHPSAVTLLLPDSTSNAPFHHLPPSPQRLLTQLTTPPTTPRGYDPSRPDTLYCDNGDGSLFSVGIAGPTNYDTDGMVPGA